MGCAGGDQNKVKNIEQARCWWSRICYFVILIVFLIFYGLGSILLNFRWLLMKIGDLDPKKGRFCQKMVIFRVF
jgi:hypothetical protein